MSSDLETLYTVQEVADHLKVTKAAIYLWMREGKLKYIYIAGLRRVRQSDLEAFIQESTRRGLAGSSIIESDIRTPALEAMIA